MSSSNVSGLCLQKQKQQEYQDDIEVEDTIVSPLVEGSSEAACAFEDVPHEIFAMIMTRLDPISQICFSLTGSRFRQIFKGLAAFDQYLLSHGDRCFRAFRCYSARLSVPLSIQVSECEEYIYDLDSGCKNSMPFDYDSVEWGPTLADYLWDESFFWSGGAKWCHECYRILPPTSWDQCEFEKEFWDHVESPSVWKEEPHKLITNLLARALICGVERGSEDYAKVSNPAGFLQQILAVDEATVYQSRGNDIDHSLCTKCRIKSIVTDNGRRQEAWTGEDQGGEAPWKQADGVAMNGVRRLILESHVNADFLSFGQPNGWMFFVLWKDVLRECGLFVKEYERVDLLRRRSLSLEEIYGGNW
ncbi:ad97e079-d71e-4aad-b559-04dcfd5528a3 [Sclerotinia trifoliorum]|uniref:Ad97e079-d71e-4aad-b559-04dcfd5528a3 n=1 Tax=Sclerotinia trifoliorum TaxID=28548 RepID=A0A8H2ZLY6_9HELO|nr:ad97e079-d71e-4aad-b559-04dcfd5528a3 [Sclerotinia trifoliorum]